MKNTKFSFLKGMASVFQVCPAGDYQQYVPQEPNNIYINKHWTQVGRYFETAINKYEQGRTLHDQKNS